NSRAATIELFSTERCKTILYSCKMIRRQIMMNILGIDPGYGTIGYGIVRYDNYRFTPIQYGAITTQIGAPMHLRLCELYDDLCTLIDTFHPDAAAVEELFFNQNITTGIQVAQARGVILLAL